MPKDEKVSKYFVQGYRSKFTWNRGRGDSMDCHKYFYIVFRITNFI